MRKERALAQAIVLGSLLVVAGLVFAAGPGEPVRGIPYRGYLELGSVPVSEAALPMTFRLFDDPGAGAAELWSDSFGVDVAAGAFSVILGQGAEPLPPSVFASAELWLAVEVNGTAVGARQQLWSMAQAQRAADSDRAAQALHALTTDGAATSLEVPDGRIWRAADPGGTTDLGLYSGEPGAWVRVVTEGGQAVFYNDGGSGTSPDLTIRSDVTEVHNTLKLDQPVFGAFASMDVNQNYVAPSNGFVVVRLLSDTDGERGYADLVVDGTVVTSASVHAFVSSDVYVSRGGMTVPIAKGSTWRVSAVNTSGTVTYNVYFVSMAP